jgi:cysteine desulfurase
MRINGSLYFDYQASTPADPQVLAAMEPYWREAFGNPHASNHSLGWAAAHAVEQAREHVASLIGADSDEIIFTSGATEANNLAILGLCKRVADGKRRRILVSAIEHKCVLSAARALQPQGFSVELIPVDAQGRVSLEALRQQLKDDVCLVSVMAVNNEIGTFQDVEVLAGLVHAVGAVFHCDAAQAPVAIPLDTLASTVDCASLSSHKMYGPQGVGALYLRRNLHSELEPLLHGGGQERGLRSGTLPLPLIVGFGKAATLITHGDSEVERARVQALRDDFVSKLKVRIPHLELNGPAVELRHPGNANLRFPYIAAADLLLALQPKLAASMGAACTSGIPEPSHILRALGHTADEADASIRFSLGRFTDAEMVIEAVDRIIIAYSSARAMQS